MAPAQRRVKPHKEASDDEISASADSKYTSDSSDEESSTRDIELDESSNDSNSEHVDNIDLGSVSFGALARAQDALGKRKRGAESAVTLRSAGGKGLRGPNSHADGDVTEDGRPTRERKVLVHRSSKHAPTEVSSKKAVSRKREAVVVPKRDIRDPRFEPLAGPLDETKIRKNYSFLEEYRDSEIKLIRDEIKKTKDEEIKERLKKQLLSMESKKKAQQAKDKQQEIVNAHRKKERDLVKQGKKPFYLKKAEQKKLALVDRFSKMKGKELNHAIERKRKKKAAKERKNMPDSRREIELRNQGTQ